MKGTIFSLLLAFIIPLYSTEPLLFEEQIGNFFYKQPKEKEKPLKVVGELLFFGENIGYTPVNCHFSPGFRASFQTPPLFSGIKIEAKFTHWKHESKKTFRIPVMHIERSIHNYHRVNSIQLNAFRNFDLSKVFRVEPIIGISWENTLRKMSLVDHWEKSTHIGSLGPLAGVDLHLNPLPNITISTHLFFSYLHSEKKNRFDHQFTSFFQPKSTLGVEIGFRIPKTFFSLKTGYEIYYYWMQSIHQSIDWEYPSNIQGFKGEFHWEF